MTFRLRILPEALDLPAEAGITLLAALRAGGVFPEALCGGNGTCGKCAVEIVSGMEPGRYLACQVKVTGDLTLSLATGAACEKVSAVCTASPVKARALWAAVDIGTTSLVCALLDAETGEQLVTVSAANPQAAYGADVISRIQYAAAGGLETLRTAVVSAINGLLSKATARVGALPASITRCCLVGNSCMQHLFFGLSPETLGQAPYEPVIKAAVVQNAGKAGLAVHPAAELLFLPLIAGFVGADTVGCLLAENFDRLTEPTLLIDIGTNGELALATPDRRFACSTAAGPAFEGARIHFGMRGEAGAIDHVRLKNGACICSVIGGGKARGICGSGLLDAAAALIACGIVDETGRMAGMETLPDGLPSALAGRITEFEGKPAFVLAKAGMEAVETDVLLTQKDIRELQLAKGALFAGIQLLVSHAGLSVSDIRTVLLAGAFGSFLDVDSACAIGLIPAELQACTRAVGNAALAGAVLALQSEQAISRAKALAADTAFVELAVCPSFQDVFVDALGFPAQE